MQRCKTHLDTALAGVKTVDFFPTSFAYLYPLLLPLGTKGMQILVQDH